MATSIPSTYSPTAKYNSDLYHSPGGIAGVIVISLVVAFFVGLQCFYFLKRKREAEAQRGAIVVLPASELHHLEPEGLEIQLVLHKGIFALSFSYLFCNITARKID
jgi:hypothetical protein